MLFAPYKLRTALLGFVVIPVIALIGASGAYSLYGLEQEVQARMQKDIELVARAIRLPLSHALERDRAGSIQQALDSAFDIDRVYGVYVYDGAGEQIASSGTTQAQVKTEEAARLASVGDERGEFGQAGSESIFSYFVPLTDTGGRINGLLQVTRRGSDFSDYITGIRNQTLIALTAIGILMIIVVLTGHYGAIGRHLRKIEQGMVKIGFGEDEHRVPVEGPAEMQVLGDGINAMLDRIARSRKEIEQRQAREIDLRLRLQQSEKLAAIGQLASGIAHELGTPLSTVDGKAQQMLRSLESGHPLHRNLEQIRTETARMEQIIRQLLDFGRNNPLTLVEVDCTNLIRTAADKIEQETADRDIEIQACTPSQPLIFKADKMRMEQAVTNLLRNAMHACNRKIRISCTANNDHLFICVEDDGPGIDEAQRPYLFDPFYTTKTIGEGTGLGLSVTHAAVADHNGHIEVDRSQDLKGACFRIVLDLNKGAT
ncbi:MAG: HAMP domain-containing sensor histidine kinase [Gammaproteobacteria bacterium]